MLCLCLSCAVRYRTTEIRDATEPSRGGERIEVNKCYIS